ncbi:Protein TIFY 6B [Euphorbia peplus]|nr:Protein TIFY 6B [Euphorbia peplus]
MERDFLGIGSKNAPITVKDEHDGADSSYKDSGPMRSSAMQWSYSNKVSAVPQFLSFKNGLEERPKKSGSGSGNGNDSMSSSSGFASISATDGFDSNHKTYSSIAQKSMNLDGNHYGISTTYPLQQHFDAYQVHRPQQTRVFPVSNQQNQNQSITISTSGPVLQSHFGSMNSQALAGVPVVSPVPVHPTPSSIVGTTELRNGSKSSGSRPAQLTIFYGGSVCVYDDISPEKAQAIMLLAGNESSVTRNKMTSASASTQLQSQIARPSPGDGYIGNRASASTVQLQSPIVRPPSRDGYIVHKVHTSPPISRHPSPISLSSTTVNEVAITEPPKAVSSAGPSSANLNPSVTVPQARKASLARFLEKRKERVISSSPYNVTSKKSPDYAVTILDGMSLSMNSFSSSCHLQKLKDGLR